MKMSEGEDPKTKKARIAVIGCGWWSQGWHIPHLLRNHDKVTICALVDPSDHPKSEMNPHLEPVASLAAQCGNCPVFTKVQDLVQSDVAATMTGALVCTPHSTHYNIAQSLIQVGMERAIQQGNAIEDRNNSNHLPGVLHILLEKPMTTSVDEAKQLDDLVHSYRQTCTVHNLPRLPYFQINHSANFRESTKLARKCIEKGKIGTLRHINASMASPLSWLFHNAQLRGWTQPSEGMLGNGFAWGQQSHLLAWIFHVCGETLEPQTVYCAMQHSVTSGADVAHAATVRCNDNITMAISGTCLLPGNEHGDPPVGKEIHIQIYGSDGALIYSGNDHDPSSGKLELRIGAHDNLREEGSVQILSNEFWFENGDKSGMGPESLQSFVAACCGQDYYVGADTSVGLKSVQTLDAMYRSQASGQVEDVAYRRAAASKPAGENSNKPVVRGSVRGTAT